MWPDTRSHTGITGMILFLHLEVMDMGVILELLGIILFLHLGVMDMQDDVILGEPVAFLISLLELKLQMKPSGSTIGISK